MRNNWIFLLWLFPACIVAQSRILSVSDSLRLDSLAKKLIQTGGLEVERLSDFETDKVLEMRNLMGLRLGMVGVERQKQTFQRLERERTTFRDSVIQAMTLEKNATLLTNRAEILLLIGDSTSLRFLMTHLDIAFNAGAWYSDLWGQYPVARLICNAALRNLAFYPHARQILLEKELDDPLNYIFAELFGNIFKDNEEILYIFFNKMLQEYPENETLKANILSIKTTLKNY